MQTQQLYKQQAPVGNQVGNTFVPVNRGNA